MTTSTSYNDEVTQVLSFSVGTNSEFDLSHSKAGSKWRATCRMIEKQPGWEHLLWGRDMYDLNVVNVYITWIDGESAEAFLAAPSFATIFHGIASSPVSSTFFRIRGSICHGKPTEALRLYNPISAPLHDHDDFKQQLSTALQDMWQPNGQERNVISVARGRSISEVKHRGQEALVYLVLLTWSSLDDMYRVKNNVTSTYNLSLLCLKAMAMLGSEVALYPSLMEHEPRTGCTIL
ncbi:MAG: hypothetical protein Q9217_006661 [Psora testacea]